MLLLVGRDFSGARFAPPAREGPLEGDSAVVGVPIGQPSNLDVGNDQVALTLLDGPSELGANGGLQEIVGVGVELECKGLVAAGLCVRGVLVVVPDRGGLRLEDDAAPGKGSTNPHGSHVGGGVFRAGVGLVDDGADFDLTFVVTGESGGTKSALNVEVVAPVAGHDTTAVAIGIPGTPTGVL